MSIHGGKFNFDCYVMYVVKAHRLAINKLFSSRASQVKLPVKQMSMEQFSSEF